MGLHAIIPNDAFTAETLGTERAGNGVLINERGLVLTIGYLITEAETIWLHLNDGRVVPGHVLGYDQATGFGLVQALAKLDLPALPLGDSTMIPLDEKVVDRRRGRTPALGRGARRRQAGIRRLLGIRARRGDLHRAGASELGRHRADRPGGRPARHRLAAARARARARLERAPQHDRADRRPEADPRRPDEVRQAEPAAAARGSGSTRPKSRSASWWSGSRSRGPAQAADIRTGDIILAVDGREVSELATMFRKVWSLGNAGVDVPLLVYRDGRTFEATITSSDRAKFLKGPSVH